MPRASLEGIRHYYEGHPDAYEARPYPGGRHAYEEAFLVEVSTGLGETAMGGGPVDDLRYAGEFPLNEE